MIASLNYSKLMGNVSSLQTAQGCSVPTAQWLNRLLLKGEEPLFCVPCHESLSLERVLLYCSDLIDAKERFFQTSSLKMLYRHVSQDTFSGKLAFLTNCNGFGVDLV